MYKQEVIRWSLAAFVFYGLHMFKVKDHYQIHF
jgi:hypothetical protein